MYIDKKNYWLRLPIIDKFLKKIILKNRIKIYRIFEKNSSFDENTKIIDVGTTPILDEHENIIFHHYKWTKNITGFSNQDCTILKENLFKSNNFVLGDAKNIKCKDHAYDVSFCSATIEHVGSYLDQKKLISELTRISKKYIFITTPNRNFPIDFHTKLPLIHLLPKKVHRKILYIFGLNYFSKEENLNLLNTNEIKQICEELNIKNFEIIYNKFFFLNSNIILIIKK
jgi:hypothetical protein|tara:strand:- start:210 stop:893 length:684 start_codon:yes stop_codon:yes gene_type:complete